MTIAKKSITTTTQLKVYLGAVDYGSASFVIHFKLPAKSGLGAGFVDKCYFCNGDSPNKLRYACLMKEGLDYGVVCPLCMMRGRANWTHLLIKGAKEKLAEAQETACKLSVLYVGEQRSDYVQTYAEWAANYANKLTNGIGVNPIGFEDYCRAHGIRPVLWKVTVNSFKSRKVGAA